MSFSRKKYNNKPKLAEGVEPKVKRVAKKEQDGIKFDSALELYMYNLLMEHNINFILKKEYVLQPSFSYAGDTVRAITLTVDFYLPDYNIILDPKGFQHGDNDLKWKLLKYHLYTLNENPRICFVYSQKAAREFMEQLANGFKEEIADKFIGTRIKKLRKHLKLSGGEFTRPDGEVAITMDDLKSMPNYDFYKLLLYETTN